MLSTLFIAASSSNETLVTHQGPFPFSLCSALSQKSNREIGRLLIETLKIINHFCLILYLCNFIQRIYILVVTDLGIKRQV